MRRGRGDRPSLLFVAHRREILEQSLRTYREVLADAILRRAVRRRRAAGALAACVRQRAVADVLRRRQHPRRRLRRRRRSTSSTTPRRATYRRLLDHLRPRELLGLTATPERADGVDVRSFFDGRTAAELRLWDALGADLLCPFHYFAVADGTDLRGISWKRGRYDEGELADVYTGNDARAAIVLQQLRDKVLDLGHDARARASASASPTPSSWPECFNDAGIPARAVSGETPRHEREQALHDLRDRRVNVLFAADLFNEGLDLPDVDTVLFLRPTESATVFLQQLGRGLRRTHDKAVLTVLDFVGHHRKEFRFDLKLPRATGHTRRGLERDIERGLPVPARPAARS